MFTINDDMSIYVTRGDVAFFTVTADNNGVKYKFKPGEVVRFKVTDKKACENVAFYKDFPITSETENVEILLTEEETKIGDVISKPTDFWYEVELNPFSNPQTILGYDDNGPKIFILFPEGGEQEKEPIDPEDIPVVDSKLDTTSTRPVENQAIARAVVELETEVRNTNLRFDTMATLKEGSTTGDAELADIRVAFDGRLYGSAGNAVRGQIRQLSNKVDAAVADFTTPIQEAIASAENAKVSTDEAKVAEVAAKQSASEAEVSAVLAAERENGAKASEEACLGALEEVKLRTVKTEFAVDFATGHILIDAPAFEFAINVKGHLEWGVR